MKHSILHITTAVAVGFVLIGGHTVLGQTSVQTIATDPASVQSTTTTNSAGTISEFSPDTIVVKTESSAEPIHYTYSKSTTYVDESGNPVSIETVKSGLPVTVYYVRDGDTLVTSKVIVRRTVVAPAVNVQESKTTTTTTTDK